MQTIKRKLGAKADAKSRAALTAALCSRRTEPGARDSLDQAIKAAASSEKADYIRDNWSKTLRLWANCSREHSALLLQVLTTNPNESFHRSLKSLARITKRTIRPKYSLAGIIQLVAQCASQYDARAQSAAYDWPKKKLSAALEHPWLSEFPYPVQLLLLGEIKDSVKLAEKGADADLRLTESGKCHCCFARSYWLPCKHVIYAFNFLDKIEEPNWKEYAEQFDESGFEIYISRGLVEVEDEIGTVSRDLQAKLVTSETLDSIRTRFFELSEFTDELDSDEKERLLKRWEEELADFSSAFIGRSLSEWLNRDDGAILF
jgi:hypothetical protein